MAPGGEGSLKFSRFLFWETWKVHVWKGILRKKVFNWGRKKRSPVKNKNIIIRGKISICV